MVVGYWIKTATRRHRNKEEKEIAVCKKMHHVVAIVIFLLL